MSEFEVIEVLGMLIIICIIAFLYFYSEYRKKINTLQNKYYNYTVVCNNCIEYIELKIPKGVPWNNFEATCPNCGSQGILKEGINGFGCKSTFLAKR